MPFYPHNERPLSLPSLLSRSSSSSPFSLFQEDKPSPSTSLFPSPFAVTVSIPSAVYLSTSLSFTKRNRFKLGNQTILSLSNTGQIKLGFGFDLIRIGALAYLVWSSSIISRIRLLLFRCISELCWSRLGGLQKQYGEFFLSEMSQYYDIDDVIAEDELVPAVFQVAANGVGLFDSSDETDKVEQGSKVELPFWLARELHLRQAVSISLPPCFNQKTREELAADAAHVDLKSRCPYFYELGCKLFSLVGDKSIGFLLLAAFQTRYKEVLIKAQTAALAVAPKFLTILTKEETKLYEAGQSSMAAFKKWRMGGPRFQKASVLGRKRKPSN